MFTLEHDLRAYLWALHLAAMHACPPEGPVAVYTTASPATIVLLTWEVRV
jgi:hypothetical protein